MHARSSVLLLLALFCLAPAAATAAPRVATIPVQGDPAFAARARTVVDVLCAIDPSLASGNGLVDDAIRVPSYEDLAVARLRVRLQAAMAAMRRMPWRSWSVDAQIDFRWVYANAELAERELAVERIWTRRPGAWLEPTANNLIALVTCAPRRLDAQAAVTERIPAMLAEMRRLVTRPTKRDVAVARGLVRGLLRMCADRGATPRLQTARLRAAVALRAYDRHLQGLSGLPECRMIGAASYAWRYRHAMLLPWTPERLLALARSRKVAVDAELARLQPHLEPPGAASAQERRMAGELTRDRLLALYDGIVAADREAVERSGLLTIPAGVGPIHARETPDAMVPLTGDGGSMNPPPPFGKDAVGWWNVEHFHANWSGARRLEAVRSAVEFRTNGMGPYAVHEGIPGHHLQLSIARLNADPLRAILADPVQNEGWALYAEEAFWRAGGLGGSVTAHHNVLRSYRHRIHRVIFDVLLETGQWTLQQAADFKAGGHGRVDEDVMRAVNWPAQLVCYFAGKTQIERLRDDYRRRLGAAYSERAFHDAFLAVGSVPIVFARCKLLGERVPDL